MSNWHWFLVALVVALVVYGYYHDHYLRPKRHAKQMAEYEARRTSEEYVSQKQMGFEKRLREKIDLPDGIRRQDAHIYLHLMREWFGQLAAQHRYDEAKLKKIRKDWLVYIEALEHSATSQFLALEGSDQATRHKHEKYYEEEKRQLVAIEDAFAHAAGPDAVERLRNIRSKKYDSFSIAGELAPDGYRFGISLPGILETPSKRAE